MSKPIDLEGAIFHLPGGPVKITEASREQLLEMVRTLTYLLRQSHESLKDWASLTSGRI